MTALEEYRAFMDAIGSGEWGITTGQIAGMADDAIAELQEEAKLAWLAVEAEQSVTEKLEAEVEKLANRLNKMEESYVRTINRDGEYANGLLAEVERLTNENAALRVSLHAAEGTGAPIGCPRCGGAGCVWIEPVPGSSMAGYRTSCPGCGGRGWVK